MAYFIETDDPQVALRPDTEVYLTDGLQKHLDDLVALNEKCRSGNVNSNELLQAHQVLNARTRFHIAFLQSQLNHITALGGSFQERVDLNFQITVLEKQISTRRSKLVALRNKERQALNDSRIYRTSSFVCTKTGRIGTVALPNTLSGESLGLDVVAKDLVTTLTDRDNEMKHVSIPLINADLIRSDERFSSYKILALNVYARVSFQGVNVQLHSHGSTILSLDMTNLSLGFGMSEYGLSTRMLLQEFTIRDMLAKMTPHSQEYVNSAIHTRSKTPEHLHSLLNNYFQSSKTSIPTVHTTLRRKAQRPVSSALTQYKKGRAETSLTYSTILYSALSQEKADDITSPTPVEVEKNLFDVCFQMVNPTPVILDDIDEDLYYGRLQTIKEISIRSGVLTASTDYAQPIYGISTTNTLRIAPTMSVRARFTGIRVVLCYKFVDQILAYTKDLDKVFAALNYVPPVQTDEDDSLEDTNETLDDETLSPNDKTTTVTVSVPANDTTVPQTSTDMSQDLDDALALTDLTPADEAAQRGIDIPTNTVDPKSAFGVFYLDIIIDDLAAIVPVSSTSPEMVITEISKIAINNSASLPNYLIYGETPTGNRSIAPTINSQPFANTLIAKRPIIISRNELERLSNLVENQSSQNNPTTPDGIELSDSEDLDNDDETDLNTALNAQTSQAKPTLTQKLTTDLAPKRAPSVISVFDDDEFLDFDDAASINSKASHFLINKQFGTSADEKFPEADHNNPAFIAYNPNTYTSFAQFQRRTRTPQISDPAGLIEHRSLIIQYQISIDHVSITSVVYSDNTGLREQSAAPKLSNHISLYKFDLLRIPSITVRASQHAYVPFVCISALSPTPRPIESIKGLYFHMKDYSQPLTHPDFRIYLNISSLNILFSQPHLSLLLSLLHDDAIFPGSFKEKADYSFPNFAPPTASSHTEWSRILRYTPTADKRQLEHSLEQISHHSDDKIPSVFLPAVTSSTALAALVGVQRSKKQESLRASKLASKNLSKNSSKLHSRDSSKNSSRLHSRRGSVHEEQWTDIPIAKTHEVEEIKPKKSMSLDLEFTLDRFAMQLITNPVASRSDSIAFLFGMKSAVSMKSDGSIRAAADVTNILAVNSTLSVDDPIQLFDDVLALPKTTAIISPFNLSTQVSLLPSAIPAELITSPLQTQESANMFGYLVSKQAISCDCRVSDINIKLSYHDYEQVFACLGTLSMPPSETYMSVDTQPQPAVTAPTTQVTPASTTNELKTVTGPGELKHSLGDMRVSFQCNTITILLVNDAPGFPLPFARIRLPLTTASVKSFAHTMDVTATTSFEMDFHNGTLVAWEPLIEPCSFKASVSKSVTQPLRISLDSLGKIDINFTKAMAEGLAQSLDLVSKAQKAQKAKITKRLRSLEIDSNEAVSEFDDDEIEEAQDITGFSYFRLHNGTNTPLYYSFGRLPHNDLQPFAFPTAIQKPSTSGLNTPEQSIIASQSYASATFDNLVEGYLNSDQSVSPHDLAHTAKFSALENILSASGGYLPNTPQALEYSQMHPEKAIEDVLCDFTSSNTSKSPFDFENVPNIPDDHTNTHQIPIDSNLSSKIPRDKLIQMKWALWKYVALKKATQHYGDKNSVKALEPYTSCPFYFDEEAYGTIRELVSQTTFQHGIRVYHVPTKGQVQTKTESRLLTLQIDGYLPIRNISVDSAFSRAYSLVPGPLANQDVKPITVVVEVAVSNGVKIVSVHSTRGFVNMTDRTIVINSSQVITPGSTHYLPLHSTSSVQFSLGDTHKSLRYNYEELDTNTSVTCGPANENDLPFIFILNKWVEQGTTYIGLCPPVTITNLLANTADVRLFALPVITSKHADSIKNTTDMKLGSTALAPAQTARSYISPVLLSFPAKASSDNEAIIDTPSLPGLSIRIPELNIDWTQALPLTNNKNHTFHIKCVDNKHRELYIYAEVTYSNYIARTNTQSPSSYQILPVHKSKLAGYGDNQCQSIAPGLSSSVSQTYSAMKVVLYTPYWLFDSSLLGVVVSQDKLNLGIGQSVYAEKIKYTPSQQLTAIKMQSNLLDPLSATNGSSIGQWPVTPGQPEGTIERCWSNANMYSPENPLKDKDNFKVRARILAPKNSQGKITVKEKRNGFTYCSHWSDVFSLSAVGSTNIIDIDGLQQVSHYLSPSKYDHTHYTISVLIRNGPSVFRRTKFVYFTPRFVVVNKLPLPIVLRQHRIEEVAELRYQAVDDAAPTVNAAHDATYHSSLHSKSTKTSSDPANWLVISSLDGNSTVDNKDIPLRPEDAFTLEQIQGFVPTRRYIKPNDLDIWHFPYSDQNKLVSFRMISPNDPVSSALEKVHNNMIQDDLKPLTSALQDPKLRNFTSQDLSTQPLQFTTQVNESSKTLSATSKTLKQPIYQGNNDSTTDDSTTTENHVVHFKTETTSDDKSLVTKQVNPWDDGVWSWSGYIDFNKLGDSSLIVRNSITDQAFMVKVRIVLNAPDVKGGSGNGATIILEPQNLVFPQFRIENRTSSDIIRFAQKNEQEWMSLGPAQHAIYTWDQPLSEHLLNINVISGLNTVSKEVDLTEARYIGTLTIEGDNENASKKAKEQSEVLCNPIGGLNPLYSNHSQRGTHEIHLSVIPEGPTRVLVISDFPCHDIDLVTRQMISTPEIQKSIHDLEDQYSIGICGKDYITPLDEDEKAAIWRRTCEAATRESLADMTKVLCQNQNTASHDVTTSYDTVQLYNADLYDAEYDEHNNVDWTSDANLLSPEELAELVKLRAQTIQLVQEKHNAVIRQRTLVEHFASHIYKTPTTSAASPEIIHTVQKLISRDVAYFCVRITEARWLSPAKLGGISDVYAQVTLLDQTYKTNVAFGTLNPYWNNEVFIVLEGEVLQAIRENFDSINAAPLKVSVFHKNKVFSDAFLGGVLISNLGCIVHAQDALENIRVHEAEVEEREHIYQEAAKNATTTTTKLQHAVDGIFNTIVEGDEEDEENSTQQTNNQLPQQAEKNHDVKNIHFADTSIPVAYIGKWIRLHALRQKKTIHAQARLSVAFAPNELTRQALLLHELQEQLEGQIELLTQLTKRFLPQLRAIDTGRVDLNTLRIIEDPNIIPADTSSNLEKVDKKSKKAMTQAKTDDENLYQLLISEAKKAQEKREAQAKAKTDYTLTVRLMAADISSRYIYNRLIEEGKENWKATKIVGLLQCNGHVSMVDIFNIKYDTHTPKSSKSDNSEKPIPFQLVSKLGSPAGTLRYANKSSEDLEDEDDSSSTISDADEVASSTANVSSPKSPTKSATVTAVSKKNDPNYNKKLKKYVGRETEFVPEGESIVVSFTVPAEFVTAANALHRNDENRVIHDGKSPSFSLDFLVEAIRGDTSLETESLPHITESSSVFRSETSYVTCGGIKLPISSVPFSASLSESIEDALQEANNDAKSKSKTKSTKDQNTKDQLGRDSSLIFDTPTWHFGPSPPNATSSNNTKSLYRVVPWQVPPVLDDTCNMGLKYGMADTNPLIKETLLAQKIIRRKLTHQVREEGLLDASMLTVEAEAEYEAEANASEKVQKLEDIIPEAPFRVLVSCVLQTARPIVEVSTLNVQLRIPHFGLSLIDGVPQELLYISVEKIFIELDDSIAQRAIELKVHHIQIDDQATKAGYPDCIVFGPSDNAVASNQPFIQISLNQTKTSPDYPVMVFKYASILIQEMEVRIEETLIWQLLGYINDIMPKLVSETDPTQFLAVDKRILYNIEDTSSSSTFYFSWLHIQPIQLFLTFRANPDLRSNFDDMAFNPMQLVLNVASGILGSIDAAPISLNSLIVEDAHGDSVTLMQPIIMFYVNQAIGQGYKVLGSVEFLGNPVSLVSGVGSGVKDFFYEPAQGLVSSPKDFGTGLAKGTTSLLKSLTTGVFGAASKITGSVGKGVATLTMDSDFQAKRNARNRQQVRHAGDGLLIGAKSFGHGLLSGVTGIFVDPFQGAKRDGVGGFFKGIATGVTGVVTKTASGAVDLVSHTLRGFGATFSGDSDANGRRRLPRFIPSNGLLLPFNNQSALAQFITFYVEIPKSQTSVFGQIGGSLSEATVGQHDKFDEKDLHTQLLSIIHGDGSSINETIDHINSITEKDRDKILRDLKERKNMTRKKLAQLIAFEPEIVLNTYGANSNASVIAITNKRIIATRVQGVVKTAQEQGKIKSGFVRINQQLSNIAKIYATGPNLVVKAFNNHPDEFTYQFISCSNECEARELALAIKVSLSSASVVQAQYGTSQVWSDVTARLLDRLSKCPGDAIPESLLATAPVISDKRLEQLQKKFDDSKRKDKYNLVVEDEYHPSCLPGHYVFGDSTYRSSRDIICLEASPNGGLSLETLLGKDDFLPYYSKILFVTYIKHNNVITKAYVDGEPIILV